MTYRKGKSMGNNDKSKLRDILMSEFVIKNPVSVTLTSKQSVDGRRLDEILLSRDIGHFLNRINYLLFKKRYSRYGKKLGVLPVIEGDRFTPLHCHLTLECPEDTPVFYLENLIKTCWGKTTYGRSNDLFGVKVKPVIDDGWLGYQLKNRTKRDGVMSSIDWINLTPSVSE
jgi:hypothetical protein